jgi:predicted phage gp36 major capsid-like protein
VNTTSNEWRGISSDGVTVSYSAEAAAMIDGSPVLAQPVITCRRWTAFVPYSWELGQDWDSLGSELVRLIAHGRDVNDAAGDLWNLKAAIPPGFQGQSSFAAPSAFFDRTYRLVGAGATAEAVLMEGRGGPLCGKPISEWSFNAGTSVATGGTLCIGGDFNAGYVIADRLGLTAVPIPALFSGATAGSFGYPTGQSGLAVWGRTGAGVVNANALRVLVAR